MITSYAYICVHIQEDDDLCNKLNICSSSAVAATLKLKEVGVYVTHLVHIVYDRIREKISCSVRFFFPIAHICEAVLAIGLKPG